MNELLLNKSPIRATQNKQRGRMRPAGHQFDMPGLKASTFQIKNLWYIVKAAQSDHFGPDQK